jgi:hypothetical protein
MEEAPAASTDWLRIFTGPDPLPLEPLDRLVPSIPGPGALILDAAIDQVSRMREESEWSLPDDANFMRDEHTGQIVGSYCPEGFATPFLNTCAFPVRCFLNLNPQHGGCDHGPDCGVSNCLSGSMYTVRFNPWIQSGQDHNGYALHLDNNYLRTRDQFNDCVQSYVTIIARGLYDSKFRPDEHRIGNIWSGIGRFSGEQRFLMLMSFYIFRRSSVDGVSE